MRKCLKNTGFLAVMLLGALTAHAQKVGVNTENPTRELHVEGDLKVHGLIQRSDDPSYDRVLVANAAGDVEYILRSSLLPPPSTVKKTVKNMYLRTEGKVGGNVPNPNNVLIIEDFKFRFNNKASSGADNVVRPGIEFCLAKPPSSGKVNIFTTFEQNWTLNGFEFESDPKPIVFDSNNKWQAVSKTVPGSAYVAPGEYNELYLSYPSENKFYRISIYRVSQKLNGRDGDDWFIAAEVFN